jgi:hypothetical protein
MGEAPPVFLIQLSLAEPEQSAKGLQMINAIEAFDYEGTIRFTTDKQLTQEQLNQLMDIIILQIVEPVDENQEDEDYSTRNVEVTVKEVK